MTKDQAEKAIADIVSEFERATGQGVTRLELEVDLLHAHGIDARPHEARRLGVRIHSNRYGIADAGEPQSAEQAARDLLERMGVEGAQQMTAGDLVELADLIVKAGAHSGR